MFVGGPIHSKSPLRATISRRGEHDLRVAYRLRKVRGSAMWALKVRLLALVIGSASRIWNPRFTAHGTHVDSRVHQRRDSQQGGRVRRKWCAQCSLRRIKGPSTGRSEAYAHWPVFLSGRRREGTVGEARAGAVSATSSTFLEREA